MVPGQSTERAPAWDCERSWRQEPAGADGVEWLGLRGVSSRLGLGMAALTLGGSLLIFLVAALAPLVFAILERRDHLAVLLDGLLAVALAALLGVRPVGLRRVVACVALVRPDPLLVFMVLEGGFAAW